MFVPLLAKFASTRQADLRHANRGYFFAEQVRALLPKKCTDVNNGARAIQSSKRVQGKGTV